MISNAPRRLLLLAAVTVIASCAGERGGASFLADAAAPGLAGDGWRLIGSAAAANSISGDFLAGEYAQRAGDRARAAELFQNVLDANPDDLELIRRLFDLRVATGEFEAAATLAEALGARDADADAALALAVEDVVAGDFAAAAARLEAAPRTGLSAVVTPLAEAWALAGAGDEEGALAIVDPEGAPEAARALYAYHRAGLFELAGRWAEGREALAPHVDQAPPRLRRRAARLAALEGDFAVARDVLGVVAAAHLEPDREALQSNRAPAASVASPRAGMADALIGVAAALRQQDAAGRGVFFARLATRLEPEEGENWLVLGELFLDEGDASSAQAALETTPERSPHYWEARLLRGDALAAHGDMEAAEEAFRAMAAERPERIDALSALADMLRREEEYDRAEPVFSEVLDRLGDDLEPRHWRVFYSRGIAFERTDRWPQAEADFERALELEPDHPFVLNYLGYSWVDQGMNLEVAQDMLRRAVELRPRDGFIVDSLGWAFFRLGKFEEAIEQLERAVALEPSDPVINDHLGDAYWRVGRLREARFQWRRALSLEPETDVVVEIERKLREGLSDEPPEERG